MFHPNWVSPDSPCLCQPVRFERGELVQITLPDRLARMYLEMEGDWSLPPLTGVTTAPLLADDGAVLTRDGYDSGTGLWCAKVPTLVLPDTPTRTEAEDALMKLRRAFRTFPFADSARKFDKELGIDVVDLDIKPGRAESSFLAGLLTAVCRASLWLAPGMMVVAPAISGAGSGKGLLVRSICAIAFGMRPRAFTAGSERAELDKRLAGELVEASPVLFLDNVNGASLNSELLASVLTERPARVRVLGETRMVMLNSTAFVAVTGNGLSVSLDLARRFIVCDLDAQREDPEARPFPSGFLDQIDRQRAKLLAAAVTIWRWGRQSASSLIKGKPLGSYEKWCEWVRDPLLTLGCGDPVEQIEVVKANDPRRQQIAELFETWWTCHRDKAMKISDLADAVVKVLDPQGRGRQFQAAKIRPLVGTRAAGMVLTRQDAFGKWSAATYSLQSTHGAASKGNGHRDHRDHGSTGGATSRGNGHGDHGHGQQPTPETPMSPMPDGVEAADVPPSTPAQCGSPPSIDTANPDLSPQDAPSWTARI
jgi:hypothetical protein